MAKKAVDKKTTGKKSVTKKKPASKELESKESMKTKQENIEQVSKKRIIFNIVLNIVFIWFLIGAFFFPPAIPAVIGIFILIKVVGNKKYTRMLGEAARIALAHIALAVEEVMKTGAALVFHTHVILTGTTKEFYNLIGGEAGAKKILDTYGKFIAEVGKITVDAGIVTVKAIAEVTKHTIRRLEEEQQRRLTASERKTIKDNIGIFLNNNAEDAECEYID
ncbi:MAG: hypothetical protein FWG46_00835 [Treponema sp.]|nr:hypothetical protein [Treponema sp.]